MNSEADHSAYIAKRRFQAEYRRNPEWKPLRDYFAAVRVGNEKIVKESLNSGISVNAVEPTTTFTALHYAASRRASALLETLLDQHDLDHLKRDGLGRLPSQLASTCAGDIETARRLRTLEMWQAQDQGVTLPYRLK